MVLTILLSELSLLGQPTTSPELPLARALSRCRKSLRDRDRIYGDEFERWRCDPQETHWLYPSFPPSCPFRNLPNPVSSTRSIASRMRISRTTRAYRIAATLERFKTFVSEGILLRTAETGTVDIQLQLGDRVGDRDS